MTVHLERLAEVRISQHNFSSYDLLGCVEGSLFLLCPSPFDCLGRQGCERSKNMRSSDPHVSAVVDYSTEAAQLSAVLRSIDLQDSFDLVGDGFNTVSSNPVA